MTQDSMDPGKVTILHQIIRPYYRAAGWMRYLIMYLDFPRYIHKHIETATILNVVQPRHKLMANMDASTSSISLLEKAGLNSLLPLYENAERIQRLIAVLETRTSELPNFLRKFHAWVDSTAEKIDPDQTPSEHPRSVFQAYEYSKARNIFLRLR